MIGDALVVRNEKIADADDLRRLVLRWEGALEAGPGQFLHIKITDALDPLLRRPLSIAAIDREKQELTVLYRVKGRGTQLLAQVRPGECLNVLGPLGKGFTIPGFTIPEQGELVLAAGGIGAFPLLSLAVDAKAQGVKTTLLWGGESKDFFTNAGLALWERTGIEIVLASIDGSIGLRGLVTDLLKEKFPEDGTVSGGDGVRIAVCGPVGMLKAVTAWGLEKGLTMEISLEEKMGCGVGACLGCVCTVRDQDGNIRRAKVCSDGPVFKAEEVVWDVC